MSKMSEIHAQIENRLHQIGDYDRIAEEIALEYRIPHAEALKWVASVGKDEDYLDSPAHTEYLS